MDKKFRLKCIMPMTGNSTSKNKVAAADNIIEKQIFNLSNFRDIHVDVENNWDTESDSRSLRRWMHTHIFLSDFTRAYAETKDQKYFIESFKLLENWFNQFPITEIENVDPLAYHDEGTAIRLLFWFKYYNEFRDLMNEDQIRLFEEKIDEIGNLLYQDDFYAGLNNHGMFQDMGLIAYTLFKFEYFAENEIFNKAMDRLTTYFKEVFTSEGIHKEHAPSYHILLIYSLKQILQALEKVDYEDDRVAFLKNIFKKGEDYSINIIMPDFKLPNISDSTVINMSTIGRYKELFDSEEYRFITSAGGEGVAPSPLIKAYPETGYLIARNKWEKDAIYFLFLASYHMHYHKHTDDLSFILYKNGPIFVDAGPHSYNYKDSMTQYAYSQYGHSTLIVNDKSLPRTDFKFDDVYVENHSINDKDNAFVIKARNQRYENVVHTRKIDGNLEEEVFSIKDTIKSDERNQYQLLFQVNGDLKVIQNGSILSIFKNNSKIAEMQIKNIENMDNVSVEVIREKKWPQLMGYQFPKTETVEPLNTIVIEGFNQSTEKNVEIETNIRLIDFIITGSSSFDRKEKVVVQGDISYVYENYGHDKLAVVFNAVHAPYKYPLESYDDLFDEKNYNVLYINDNQFKIGSSFIKGKSTSTIEADIENVIFSIINKDRYSLDDVLLFGRSKAGFAALYYGLKNGFRNIISFTPLSKIGDYYNRHDQYKDLLIHLADNNNPGNLIYLNNYIFNISLKNYPYQSNIYIGIGEKDYHKKKHTLPIIDWLKNNNIEFKYEEEKNLGYQETKNMIKNVLPELLK
ncbi:alginate lyase family protein [Salinicoccus sp. HZC-1]|uniref:alginate lyase family protein n=1 Tax=Salinicoccus sp. HZC-1 TaxID=3385497 RepID=UPI00398B5987